MDRERAETYLRLLAEAELRRATMIAARGAPGWGPSARLALAAQALSAVGASPWGNAGLVVLSMMIIPPLDRGTAWIEISAAGPSAQARATLPLSSP